MRTGGGSGSGGGKANGGATGNATGGDGAPGTGGSRATAGASRTRDLVRIRPRSDDTIIVAGGDDGAIREAVQDRRLARWLRSATAVVRRLTSVCSGAFILAAAGLLEGRRAATHWSACERLARLFPSVKVAGEGHRPPVRVR